MNAEADVGSTLGIRFEIGRLESGNYRIAAWQVVWDAVEPGRLAPAKLYEGETAGSLARQENVFCIAVTGAGGAIEALRRALEGSPEFHRVAAMPAFLDAVEVTAEPLAEAGSIAAHGELDGHWPRRGLAAAQARRPLMVGAAAPPEGPPPAPPAAEYSALLGPAPAVEPPPVIERPPVVEPPPVAEGTPVGPPPTPGPGTGAVPAARRPRRWPALVAVGAALILVALAVGVLGGGGGGGGPLASRADVEAKALPLLEKVNLSSFGNPTVESVTCPDDPPSATNKTFECGVRFSNGTDARLLVAFADTNGALAWCSIGSEGRFVLNMSALSGACKSDGATTTSAQASTTTTQAPTTTAPVVAPPTTVTSAPATTTTKPTTATTARPTTTTRPPTTTTVPVPTGAAVTTAAGRLAIDDVRFTDLYPAGCHSTDAAGCLTASGNRIVVLVLHAAAGKSSEETMDLITEEALGIESGSGSEIDDGSGENLTANMIRSTSASPTVEVVYAFLADENPSQLTLIWPGNAPIPLDY